MVDLTGSDAESETELESGEFSQGDSQMKNDKARRPDRQDFKVQTSSCRDAPVCAQQHDRVKVKPKQRCRDFQTQPQKQTDLAPVHSPVVKLRRSSFLERHLTELSTFRFSASLTNGCVPVLLQPKQQNSHKTIIASNDPPTTKTNPSKPTDPNCVSLTSTSSPSKTSTVKQTPNSEHTRAETSSEWQPQEVQADDFTNRTDPLCRDITVESELSASDTKDMDYESAVHEYDLDTEDPVYFFWQDWSYEERVDKECGFESDFRSASPVDRDFVCPVALTKITSGQAQSLVRYFPTCGFI